MQNFEDLWSLVQMGFFWGGGGVWWTRWRGEGASVCNKGGEGEGCFCYTEKRNEGYFW